VRENVEKGGKKLMERNGKQGKKLSDSHVSCGV
jgi:hypothetical protein